MKYSKTNEHNEINNLIRHENEDNTLNEILNKNKYNKKKGFDNTNNINIKDTKDDELYKNNECILGENKKNKKHKKKADKKEIKKNNKRRKKNDSYELNGTLDKLNNEHKENELHNDILNSLNINEKENIYKNNDIINEKEYNINENAYNEDNINKNIYEDTVYKDEYYEDDINDINKEFSNALKNVDLNSFYGSTGKIIKIRICNFLNHQNLELTFNSSKNLIIGKNGKGKSAIAQAVSIALGNNGRLSGRNTSIANYIKDYDKDKKNLTCKIEIFLSNSGKYAFKKEKYGNVIMLKRIITPHKNKFYLYGLNSKMNKNFENIKIKKENINRCGYKIIENYLNFIKLNIKSPCVYLDQEKGKRYFTEISESNLYDFFMNALGLNIIEEEIKNEENHLKNCSNEINNKKTIINDIELNLEEEKKRNDIINEMYKRLYLIDKSYEMVVFYNSLKNVIILLNEYLKSQNNRIDDIVNKIESRLYKIIYKCEEIKKEVKNIYNKGENIIDNVCKNRQKIKKYEYILNELNVYEKKYNEHINEYTNYLNNIKDVDKNKNLMEKYLNKYKTEVDIINKKVKKANKKEEELEQIKNNLENNIYENELLTNEYKQKLNEINLKIKECALKSKEIQTIKNENVKKAFNLYKYDIDHLRNKILQNYDIKKLTNRIYNEKIDINNYNQLNMYQFPSSFFENMPIGPVGDYIKINGIVNNENILSIIEKHLKNFFYYWIVSCYEDKVKLISLSNNKIPIIITNSFKYINREKLLKNIKNITDNIKGNTIISYLEIDSLPTTLLFYLYDNYHIAKTLICNNSMELNNILKINNKKLLKCIYIIEDMTLANVLPNGDIYFIPFNENEYKKPKFLKNNYKNNIDNINEERNINLDEELKKLQKEQELTEKKVLRNEENIINDKNKLKDLNETLKKSKQIKENLNNKLIDIEELLCNHNIIFTERLEEEIKEKTNMLNEIKNDINEIKTYKAIIQYKKEDSEKLYMLNNIILPDKDYLKQKMNILDDLLDEYDNMKELYIKNIENKKNYDEISKQNKEKLLHSLNKLHTLYYDYISKKYSFDLIFLNNSLIYKNISNGEIITNIILEYEEDIEKEKEEIEKKEIEIEKKEIEIEKKEIEIEKKKHNDNKNKTLFLVFVINNINENLSKGEIKIRQKITEDILDEINKKNLLISKKKKNISIKKIKKNEINNCNKINNNLLFNDNNSTLKFNKTDEIKYLSELKNHIYENFKRINNENLVFKNDDIDEIINSNDIHDNKKLSDILWKERCNLKKEIFEMLKVCGLNIQDNTDNSLKYHFEQLIDKYNSNKDNLDKQLKQINELQDNHDMHYNNLVNRKKKYKFVHKYSKKKIINYFQKFLKKINNYNGKLTFDDDNHTLSVAVSINQNISNDLYMNLKSLSGGEKSSIQMALLVAFSLSEESPFHIYDELDVYMDEFTRVKNFKLFFKFMNEYKDKQYFFITPHMEIAEIFLDFVHNNTAKIINL